MEDNILRGGGGPRRHEAIGNVDVEPGSGADDDDGDDDEIRPVDCCCC